MALKGITNQAVGSVSQKRAWKEEKGRSEGLFKKQVRQTIADIKASAASYQRLFQAFFEARMLALGGGI